MIATDGDERFAAREFIMSPHEYLTIESQGRPDREV
jgi:hypothetical protein